MGTTPAYGLPYPEATDLVINGDDAMQALAEAVEALVQPSYGSATISGAVPPGGGLLTLGTWSGSAHFTKHASSEYVTYTGPTRLHLILGRITGVAVGVLDMTLWIRINSTNIQDSPTLVDIGGGTTIKQTVTGVLLRTLQSGDTIGLSAGTSPGFMGSGELQILPAGPGAV